MSKEAQSSPQAREFGKAVDVPLILVGGIRSPELVEEMLAEGTVDYFSMYGLFVREPHLVQRGLDGDLTKAKCISRNLCFRASLEESGLTCAYERKLATRKKESGG